MKPINQLLLSFFLLLLFFSGSVESYASVEIDLDAKKTSFNKEIDLVQQTASEHENEYPPINKDSGEEEKKEESEKEENEKEEREKEEKEKEEELKHSLLKKKKLGSIYLTFNCLGAHPQYFRNLHLGWVEILTKSVLRKYIQFKEHYHYTPLYVQNCTYLC